MPKNQPKGKKCEKFGGSLGMIGGNEEGGGVSREMEEKQDERCFMVYRLFEPMEVTRRQRLHTP